MAAAVEKKNYVHCGGWGREWGGGGGRGEGGSLKSERKLTGEGGQAYLHVRSVKKIAC